MRCNECIVCHARFPDVKQARYHLQRACASGACYADRSLWPSPLQPHRVLACWLCPFEATDHSELQRHLCDHLPESVRPVHIVLTFDGDGNGVCGIGAVDAAGTVGRAASGAAAAAAAATGNSKAAAPHGARERSRGNSKKLIDKCDWAHPHPQQDSCCIHWVRPSKRRNASCRQQHGWPTGEASNSPDGCSQVCAWP